MTLKGIYKLITSPKQFMRDYINKKQKKTTRAKTVAKKTTQSKNVAKKTTQPKNVAKKTNTKKEAEMIKKIFAGILEKIPVANINFNNYEVGLYFSGGMGNIYQVEQWIGPLEELKKHTHIIIIVRIKEVYEWLQENTNFTIVYCKTIEDVIAFYENSNLKVVLYVNHGFKNFQSLIVGDALHIHINHGESDKTSTITNQSKAYDYVYIVGQAAYDKYNLNLIKKDMSKYIMIGRPQLDYIEEIKPFSIPNMEGTNDTKRKVILYAPTWEGTHQSMNFTSLNNYGMSIVQQILNHPKYYLIYKPHPNTGSRSAETKKINNEIIKLLSEHPNGEAILSGDINSLYKHIDLAIFDNSAVAIDYLIVDKPMLMTDMFHNVKDRMDKPIITEACRMINNLEIYNINATILEELINDTHKEQRNKIKTYFLGNFDYSKKESAQKFISEILSTIKERDSLVEKLQKLNSSYRKKL